MGSKFCRGRASCSIGSSGILAIVSFFLWLLTAIFIAAMNKEARKRPDDSPNAGHTAVAEPTEETSTTRYTDEDGTITEVTRKTVINPDGSKVVTETRQAVGPELAE
jgi:hypothetical protein